MVSDKFLKRNIKAMIKIKSYNIEYVRGFTIACFVLEAITGETLTDIKKYFKKHLEEDFNKKCPLCAIEK